MVRSGDILREEMLLIRRGEEDHFFCIPHNFHSGPAKVDHILEKYVQICISKGNNIGGAITPMELKGGVTAGEHGVGVDHVHSGEVHISLKILKHLPLLGIEQNPVQLGKTIGDNHMFLLRRYAGTHRYRDIDRIFDPKLPQFGKQVLIQPVSKISVGNLQNFDSVSSPFCWRLAVSDSVYRIDSTANSQSFRLIVSYEISAEGDRISRSLRRSIAV